MRAGAGAPALFVFPACGRSGSFPPPACWRREDFSLPRFRGEGRVGGMASHPGRLAVIAIVVLALLAAVGYTGYAGTPASARPPSPPIRPNFAPRRPS